MPQKVATEASEPGLGSQGTVDTSHFCNLNTEQGRRSGETGEFPWLTVQPFQPIIEHQVFNEGLFLKN